MNRKSQALALNLFLTKYQTMWEQEIMNEYPESMGYYPKDWIDLLKDLSNEELYAIDCKDRSHDVFHKIKNSSLYNFINEAFELSHVSPCSHLPPIELEQWAYSGVKIKKKHEINQILPKLLNLKEKFTNKFDHIVDIGGGVGHLARIIAHYGGIDTISIDRDIEFQKIGAQRIKKYRKLPQSKDVRFVNLNFGNDFQDQTLKEIYHSTTLGVGLHTCGPLANQLIDLTINNKAFGVLSFGCCYHHLNPNKDFPISKFFREKSLVPLNLYALSLATRSHAQEDFSIFQTKLQVKNYRYGLHLFLMKYFNSKYFTDVGECPIKTYWLPFSDYVKKKLAELNLKDHFSSEFIEDYYHSKEIQTELKEMFLANLIRWQLGRCIEVYILLDRCIYLEENGYEVEMNQYFKEALSPRNIGILALSK